MAIRFSPVALLAVCSASLFLSCVPLPESEALSVRYFEIDSLVHSKLGPAPSPSLRVGSVHVAESVRESLATRRAGVELVYDETRRWAESPRDFMARLLRRYLTGEDASQGGEVLRVDVYVTALELDADARRARCNLRAVLGRSSGGLRWFDAKGEVALDDPALKPKGEGTSDASLREVRALAHATAAAIQRLRIVLTTR